MSRPDRFLPYSKQLLDEKDIEEVLQVLRGELITQGPLQAKLEKRVAKYCGAAYGVLFPNGSIALQMATAASGIAPGDALLTSPVTYVATANAALYAGAEVRFADIQQDNFNIDTGSVADALDDKVKVIIPVDFAGEPADLKSIRRIAGGNRIIISDSCHALGGEYRDSDRTWRKVGDCRNADMEVFSFHPAKNITTGEGGIVLTNSEKLFLKLKLLQNNGITRDKDVWINHDLAFTFDKSGKELANPWYYEMQELGQNCRLTELQCALGLSQMNKLDEYVSRRRKLSRYYKSRLEGSPVGIQKLSVSARSGCHLFVTQIDFAEHGTTRAELMLELRKLGIGTQVHYIPVHLQPFYRNLGFKEGDFPRSEAFYQKALSIPLFPDMEEKEADYVVETLFRLLGI